MSLTNFQIFFDSYSLHIHFKRTPAAASEVVLFSESSVSHDSIEVRKLAHCIALYKRKEEEEKMRSPIDRGRSVMMYIVIF